MTDDGVRPVPVPPGLGGLVDLAPVPGDRPEWLTLAADGTIGRWNPVTGVHDRCAVATLVSEAEREPWDGHRARRRLHAGNGFAAVVNDYGRYGQVIDLSTGEVTMSLDNAGYHDETVPFSLAFTVSEGRCVVVHRTAWNRLDVGDAATGTPLTPRPAPAARAGGDEDEHYLDYFHGALYVSPDGRRILDDGWAWHPVGIPATWRMDAWLAGDVWESEDGPSLIKLDTRGYYWDHAMTWLDTDRVAIEGLGDDDEDMEPGARIFDIAASEAAAASSPWRAVESAPVPGPRGPFFGDAGLLYADGEDGLTVWDPATARRLGVVDGFHATHHHRGAGQFARLADGLVTLWHK